MSVKPLTAVRSNVFRRAVPGEAPFDQPANARYEGYWLVLSAALLTGASCLIGQIVWSRYLNLIFGISVYAVATVLTCFMLGLALGGWLIGRWLDRSGGGRRIVLAIEIALGICALVSPLIYNHFSVLATWIIRGVAGGSIIRHTVEFSLAMLILLVPTILFGGALPGLIRIMVPNPTRVGADAGAVYACNSLGGALGAFLAGFWLIPAIGLWRTLIIAAAMNFLAAGLIAVLGVRRWRQPATEAVPATGDSRKSAASVGSNPADSPSIHRRVAIVFGLSGFAGLAYEVYWTRLLGLFFRDSIYDLTIVLSGFLLGLSAGSAIAGRLLRRRTHRSLVSSLAGVEILVGASALVGVLIIQRFPYWINDLQTNTAMVARFGEHYWAGAVSVRIGYALLLMAAPTCLLGATFALVSAICIHELPELGRKIGQLSAINSLGSAAGALVAGFVFVPLLGLQNSLILTACISILAGALLLREWLPRISIAAITIVLISLIPPWDRLRMSAGVFDQRQKLEDLITLPFYREDATGITAVVAFKNDPHRMLITNRIYSQNTSDMMGLSDHRRLGLIPMLLHPRPTSALVVGLGAGMTLHGVHDVLQDGIDCVEISPAVIEAAGLFAPENGGVMNGRGIRFISEDGRGFLTRQQKRYDVIVLDILHPMSSGSSSVFSREYFQLCRQRLASGGIVCQWLPVHQLSLSQAKSIIATFRSVFPHTSLWYGLMGDSVSVIGCVGSEQPLAIDFRLLQKRMENSSLVPELQEVNLGNPYLLLSHFIMADRAVDAFCSGARIDTDDRPLIEFEAPRLAKSSREVGAENLLQFSAAQSDIAPYLANASDFQPKELTRYVHGKRAIIGGLSPLPGNDAEERLNRYIKALSADPTNEDLIRTVQQMTQGP